MSGAMLFYPIPIILPELVIVGGTILFGLFYFLSQKKDLPVWFKGGLVATVLTVLVSFVFYGLASTILSGGMYNVNKPWTFLSPIFFILPIFILGIVIGAISGKVIIREKKVITPSFKVGFLLGLIFSMGLTTITLYGRYIAFQRPFYKEVQYITTLADYINLTFALILIIIPFATGWLFWIISSLLKKRKMF